MPRCYLMVNDLDLPEGAEPDDTHFEFAFDFGLGEDDPVPQKTEDMTPAQYAVWQMYNVLKGMVDNAHREKMEAETGSKIVIPAGSISH